MINNNYQLLTSQLNYKNKPYIDKAGFIKVCGSRQFWLKN